MIKLILIHQHDPTVPHVGGIQTFINTFIRNAPDDLSIDLLGVTADPSRYPVGQWHDLSLNGKAFRFFPLVAAHPIVVTPIPLSLKMLLSLCRYRRRIDIGNALLEFHRIEPMLGFIGGRNSKILFLHGHNRKDFFNKKTEVRWGKLPRFYFWLERMLLPQARRIYLVREDAADDYREQFPGKKTEISFLPTWVDETIFRSLNAKDRQTVKERLLGNVGFAPTSKVLLFVGRYEGQKDPLRLLEAFRTVVSREPSARLVLIGEGSLKDTMQNYVRENGLSSTVHFLQPSTQEAVSDWMNAADALCLSSAFEGMPRAAVEALHCGLPVVGTAVGETNRLIADTKGGRIVTEAGAKPFAEAILDLLDNPPNPEACREQVEAFTARKILSPVYQSYRDLALESKI